MDKHSLEHSSASPSVLINYCIASDYSSVVMFPFAWSALSNHASTRKANLEVDLFWWNSDEEEGIKVKEEKLNSSLLTLSKEPYAQVDLGYRATRDVKAGEELLYSYGQEWQDAWMNYSAKVSEWSETTRRISEINELQRAFDVLQLDTADLESLSAEAETDMPVFRHFIGGLDHLFPLAWRDLVPIADSR